MSLQYRSEIDGLRAIAVIAVIIYHAKIVIFGRDWFEGGFIGVDIFFVISGYLITRIILLELFEKNSLSFLYFYERRARRILPVLLIVILVSLPFAWHSLLPVDFVEYSKSILSAMFFGSNVFFYYATTEYGTDSALLKPFLHTWSLGVEEQYYLLFPFLLLLIYRFARQHLQTVFLILLLLSLLFSEMMVARDPELAFYLPMSRFWELLVGSILAHVELKYGYRKSRLAAQLFPVIGFYLIIHSILFFNETVPHPSFYTVLPVLGVALIIGFSSGKDLIGRILGSKPFVSTGLISYSLYLWHFPVFAFSRMEGGSITNHDKFTWIVLTVVLSVVSYFAIEKPFRNKKLVSKKYLVISLSVFSFVIILIQLSVLRTNGFQSRLPEIFVNERFSQEPWNDLEKDGKMCHGRADNFCYWANDGGSTVVNLIGDSHMASLQEYLVNRLQNQFSVTTMTMGGCWPSMDTEAFNKHGKLDEKCSSAYQNQRISEINKNSSSIVIISGRLPLYLTNQLFDNQEGGVEGGYWGFLKPKDKNVSFEKMIKNTVFALAEKGHRVLLVYPIVEVGWDVPKKLLANRPADVNQIKLWLGENPLTTSFEVYLARTSETFRVLDSLQHKNIYRVYPHQIFCDNQIKGRCVTHDDEHIFYADDDHPSYKGSEMIGDLIVDKVNEIVLADSN